MNEQLVIKTDTLSKQFGKDYRVKNVCLCVPERSIYGFLGPNGAGKTTTLKMILGLLKTTNGEISLFGKKLTPKNRLSLLSQIGSLIESPSYYGHLTGEENLDIMRRLRGLPVGSVADVLRIVRLEDEKKKLVSQYSLGMKQRLGIANALLGFPKLLILDEPTNGLDPAGIQEMRALIKSLPEQFGMTLLVSSHLLTEIDQIATHVGIIRRGELVFQDSLEQLHARSTHHLALRTGDNLATQTICRKNGMVTESHGDFLLTPMLTDDEIISYCAQLWKAGIPIFRIEERKKSLEDIFLELTGNGETL